MVALRNAFVVVVVGLGLIQSPLRAQEGELVGRGGIDRYLPADTEIISTVNFKQIFESTLFKKYAAGPAREALKKSDEVRAILDDLGFDPLKDLDKTISASPAAGEQDKGLIIVHGRFNLDKFKAKGEEVAKANSDVLKIHKINDGKDILYEVTIEGLPTSLWVSFASKNVLLASPGKDYVVDALRRRDKPGAALKNKDFQAMLEKMDGRQSISMAAVASALSKNDFISSVEQIKKALENLDAVGGGFTIGEDVNLEFVANAKTAKAATETNDEITTALNLGLAGLGLLAANNKDLAPLVDVVKGIRWSAKEKTVTIKATITAELIEKGLKKDQ